jgi:hypothetical protein
MTYTIARYPVHLIDVARIANGRRVTIRPTLPQDLELQREFFHSLSAEGWRLNMPTGKRITASTMAIISNVATARTRRAQRAFMSPAEFIALVAGWGGGLVLLFFISALARYLS